MMIIDAGSLGLVFRCAIKLLLMFPESGREGRGSGIPFRLEREAPERKDSKLKDIYRPGWFSHWQPKWVAGLHLGLMLPMLTD
jgi:hypothetical protein